MGEYEGLANEVRRAEFGGKRGAFDAVHQVLSLSRTGRQGGEGRPDGKIVRLLALNVKKKMGKECEVEIIAAHICSQKQCCNLINRGESCGDFGKAIRE